MSNKVFFCYNFELGRNVLNCTSCSKPLLFVNKGLPKLFLTGSNEHLGNSDLAGILYCYPGR